MTLNKSALKLWIEALESGQYVQARNSLHNSIGCFCAVGVLCDVAVKRGIIGPPRLGRIELGQYPDLFYYNEDCFVAPKVVADWLTDWGTLTRWVSEANDHGAMFVEIAARLKTSL